MNSRDTRRYEMLVRVREFGAANADHFPPSTLGGQAFAAMASAVDDLGAHAASQFSGRNSSREGTTARAVARDALIDDLEAITRTARALAIDTPGVDDKFRARRNGGDQALITTARAFIGDAEPLAKEFVRHGLPKDFIADLKQRLEDLEEAIGDRDAGKGAVVSARASLGGAMESALRAVRRLDAIVPNVLRDDAGAIAAWTRARRIEYRQRREAAEPAPANPLHPAITPEAAASAGS